MPALGLSLALHVLLLWPAALPRMAMQTGQAPLAATLRAVAAPEPAAGRAGDEAMPVRESRPGPAPSTKAGRDAGVVAVAGQGPAAPAGPADEAPGRTEAAPAAKAAAVKADAADAAGPDADGIRTYRIGLAREARAHRHYPSLARERGWTGTAEVSVDISREGRPRHILLARSSGHDILDREAVQMMARAAASAALPETLRGRAFAVRLPVVFDLDERL